MKVVHFLIFSLLVAANAKAQVIPDWFFDLANNEPMVLKGNIDSSWLRGTCDFTKIKIDPADDITQQLAIKDYPYVEVELDPRYNKMMEWTNGYGLHVIWKDPDTKKPHQLCLYLRNYYSGDFHLAFAIDLLKSTGCRNPASNSTLPIQAAVDAVNAAKAKTLPPNTQIP